MTIADRAATVELPPVPTVPSIWSLQNVLVFIAAGAAFIVGLLAEFANILPAGTSTDVSVVSGVVAQIGALATAVLTIFSHNTTVNAVTKAQSNIHVAALARIG
jgi:hypothetical protein